MSHGGLTDIPGIKVGHFTDSRRPTGCTVVLAEAGAVAGVDVRGSAPGTRETDVLNPINSVPEVHAVVLSGGSAFGLDSACGVVRYLEEKGIGYPTRIVRVPIVPAAILFDLGFGDPSIRPDSQAGYQACLNATSDAVVEGSVGAGAGATVGKLLGPDRAMKGGIGSAAIRSGDLIVAALAAVNSLGNIIDSKTGTILAGARAEGGREIAPLEAYFDVRYRPFAAGPAENTTLAVVATNARLDKPAMTKVAQMSHDGFARAINPVHLPFDGDVAFALSTGQLGGSVSLSQVGALAAEVTARAIVQAILTATGIPGCPAYWDLQR